MSTPASESVIARFGPYELDLRTGDLRKLGRPVRLQPQPCRLLCLLIRHAGELVTREQIIQQLWGVETFVDFEHGLNFCIRHVRAVLDDDADEPKYIQTVPRRGYRFIAVVERPGAGHLQSPASTSDDVGGEEIVTASWRAGGWPTVGLVVALVAGLAVLLASIAWWQWRSNGGPTFGRQMLAVLPFENLSPWDDEDYFADGFTEDTITQLAKLDPQRLGVIARTSAMRYRRAPRSVDQIGHDLGVNYVLEGSVRRDSNHVRVTAQLIQVRDQTHLWAETYEYGVGEALAVQADLAGRIAQVLHVRLFGGGPNPVHVDPAAYENYLRGRFFLGQRTEQGLRTSFDYLQKAIQQDPTYAPTYIAMANYYFQAADWFIDRTEAWPKALAATERARELGGTSSDVHFARGRMLLADWKWQAGGAELKEAVALNPNNADAREWYGMWLSLMDRPTEAVQEVREAVRVDPLSLRINTRLVVLLWWAGRLDEALDQGRRAIELEPRAYSAFATMAMSHSAKGKYKEAIAEAQRAQQLAADDPEVLGSLGCIYALAGDRLAANLVLKRLDSDEFPLDKGTALGAAYVWAGLGDKDQAFQSLEKAYQEHDESVVMVKGPIFMSLRSDPRFHNLVRRIGFPETVP